ncbi:carbon starvation CstA family protein [Clostridium sp. DL1XJH146]
MNALVIILIAIVCFVTAYATYGSWLAKKWGIDPSRKTPAHTKEDGVDYVPAKAPVLLGHHFSSIAGAAPIVGPIAAIMFGWLPVALWIIIGSIFFGGVHDMGALFASVRHEGKSIGQVIGENMGDTGKRLFAWFAWLTLLLVVGAFTSICATVFAAHPDAASSSLMFIALAVIFGFLVYRRGAGLAISTVIGVALLFLCIFLGMKFPLSLSYNVWVIILLLYIAIASVTPVWILLQPRDYLNSFLLYAMLIGGAIGIIFTNPSIEAPAFAGFAPKDGQYLFPILFITVACGAISGFHSLVGSGTTSKQIDNEKDIKLIGYGSMLIEGFLAILALITAAYVTSDTLAGIAGGPIGVFSQGLGEFMGSFGLPVATGVSFTVLAISAFALTSLDTATRLARFIFQEMFDKGDGKQTILTNMYFSTGITVVLGGAITFMGYGKIWPIFGSANQLLAALALLSLAVYLKKQGKENKMALIPTVFMFIVTICALILLIQSKIVGFTVAGLPLLIIAVVLLVLSFVLIKEGIKALSDK